MSLPNTKKTAEIPDNYYKDRKPWERVRYEPDAAFRYFCIYKDMGADRSIAKTQKIIGLRHTNFLYTMSRKWNWQERVREWDNEVQNSKNSAMLKAVEEMNKRHAKLAVAALMPVAKIVQKFNQEIDTQTNLNELTFDDVYSMFVETIKLMPNLTNIERKARGEATEITKNDITSNEKIKIILPPNEDEQILNNDNQDNGLNKDEAGSNENNNTKLLK